MAAFSQFYIFLALAPKNILATHEEKAQVSSKKATSAQPTKELPAPYEHVLYCSNHRNNNFNTDFIRIGSLDDEPVTRPAHVARRLPGLSSRRFS
jgi:hypothetical protein